MDNVQAFDFSVDLLRHVFWKQDRSNVFELINRKNQAFNTLHSQFWTDWVRDVLNINTANQFGLSVWSIILNVPLVLRDIPPDSFTDFFGFDNNGLNFDNGTFLTQGSELGAALLTLDQQRTALKMIYQKYVTRPSVPQINRILDNAFGDIGTVFVRDGLDMTMEYVFTFNIPPWIEYIIEVLDVLPTPSGVSSTIVTEIP